MQRRRPWPCESCCFWRCFAVAIVPAAATAGAAAGGAGGGVGDDTFFSPGNNHFSFLFFETKQVVFRMKRRQFQRERTPFNSLQRKVQRLEHQPKTKKHVPRAFTRETYVTTIGRQRSDSCHGEYGCYEEHTGDDRLQSPARRTS